MSARIAPVKFRIMRGDEIAIGPGKAELLAAIERSGSISAAAKSLGMSYRRAWNLVDTMNRCFRQPLVTTATGGDQGGGAVITDFGRDVLARFDAMQVRADEALKAELKSFAELMR